MDFADLAFAVVGIGALLAASLPRIVEGRPFSLPIVFLGLGVVLGLAPFLPLEADPADHLTFLEHLTEIVVIVALMGAGLGLDRRVGWRTWANTWRLLAITMPLTIVAVVVLGMGLLGLAPAAAVLLGAALAPTDPVLAGEVQVGEPAAEPADTEQAEDEIRFSLTSEGGLNDALAFPFVYLAIAMAAAAGAGVETWGLQWFGMDVVYRIVVGLVGGLGVGWLLGRLFFSTKLNTLRLAEHREGFVALAATALAYGVTELAQGYGFLAVFVAAVMIRSNERFHGYHVVLHSFIEQIERLLTVLVLLLLGVALTSGVLSGVDWRHLVIAAALLLVVRPLAGKIGLIGGSGSRTERSAVAFFGIRGIGSIYYLAYGLNSADFSAAAADLYAVVALVITGSVVLHGITAGPLMRRLDSARGLETQAPPHPPKPAEPAP